MRWSASWARSTPSATRRPWRLISWNGATAIAARRRSCSSPARPSEVAAILEIANETKTAIVPQGGNTGLVGGQIPFETGHEVVRLARAAQPRARHRPRLQHHDGRSGAARLRMRNKSRRAPGRLFPLSLASEGSAQIGGVLATNAGGMAVLAYGSARDLALGLEVVLADGRVWNGLKSLRKDNSGYDLKDLIIGSEGTLGIITAAVLRLFPKVAERVTCMAGLSALETAPAFFARALERAGPALTAFEIMPRIGDRVRHPPWQRRARSLPLPPPWYVLFELTSPREGEELARLAETLLGEGLEAGEIMTRSSPLRWRKARSCGACAS